jgi:hypothetical protein
MLKKLGAGRLQPCNPSYSRDRDREDHGWRQARPKVYETPLQQIKLGAVARTCHPSYPGSLNRRIIVQAFLGMNVKLFEK